MATEPMNPQITCVVTFHSEGSIAHRTLRGLDRACAYAEQRGLTLEAVAVLDCANHVTEQVLHAYSPKSVDLSIVESAHGDVGLARNTAISAASGEYIAILDGDDLFGENWLYNAYRVADEDPSYVVHPEITVCFDKRNIIIPHTSQNAPAFDYSNALLFESFWSSLGFARRTVFQEFPYVATPRGSGFGYEDWHWISEVMAHGCVHVTAPRTAHFVRLKGNHSRNEVARANRLLMPHSALFDQTVFLQTLCGRGDMQ